MTISDHPEPDMLDGDADSMGVPSMAAVVARIISANGNGMLTTHAAATFAHGPLEIRSKTAPPDVPDADSASAADSGEATPFEFLPNRREKYAIVTEIGRGGMSRVYATRDYDVGRIVAMKVLDEGLDAPPGDLGRFIQEAQISGQLEHPNIVPVYDLGCGHHGQVFFTMKRVRGISLAEVLFRIRHHDEEISRHYDRRSLLRILLKVCDAVAYAHDRGVIHRDLKPDNIMVGRFGEVLVMDWGIAKVIGRTDAEKKKSDTGRRLAESSAFIEGLDESTQVRSTLSQSGRDSTMRGMIAGTPAYMAPEQARGEGPDGSDRLTEKVDIYALGAILYEILTLEPPYTGENGLLIVRELLDRAPMPIRQRNPERPVPRELAAIVEKAMAREPGNRYAHAEAFSTDILNFLEERPVSVYRGTFFGRLVKWLRRQPAIAVGFGSFIVLMLVTSVLSMVALDQARAKRNALEEQLQLKQQAIETERKLGRERDRHLKRLRVEALRQQVPHDVARLDLSQVEETLGIFNRILALDPEHVPTLVDRAILQMRLRADSAASGDLDRALALSPTDERGNYYRARLAEKAGHIDAALRFIRVALERNALDFAYHVLHLRVLAARGQFETLQGEIDRLIGRSPALSGSLVKLRVRFFEWQATATADIPQIPRVLINGESDEWDTLDAESRGYTLLLDRRFAEALLEFEIACNDRSDSIAAWYGKSCCLARLDKPFGALLALETAWTNGLRGCKWPVLTVDPDLIPLHELPGFRVLAGSGAQTKPGR